MQLNRRHKAGLFLTVVAVGVSLLLDATAKVVVGIAFLSLAATWLIASIPRLNLSLKTRKAIATGLIVFLGMRILLLGSYRPTSPPGDTARLIGEVTGIVLVLVGFLFSIRWRMRLAYGHLPPMAEKVKKRKVYAIGLLVLFGWWGLMAVALGASSLETAAPMMIVAAVGLWASISWLRRLRTQERRPETQSSNAG